MPTIRSEYWNTRIFKEEEKPKTFNEKIKKILVTKAVIKDKADFEQLPISVFRFPFFCTKKKISRHRVKNETTFTIATLSPTESILGSCDVSIKLKEVTMFNQIYSWRC